jgi:hypothetical protein
MEKQDALNPCKFQQMFKYSCDFTFNQSSFFEMHFGVLLQNCFVSNQKFFFNIVLFSCVCNFLPQFCCRNEW